MENIFRAVKDHPLFKGMLKLDADKSTTLDMYIHAGQEAIKRANGIYRKALYQKAE